MLQLRCVSVTEEDLDTADQGFRLDLAVDPARLLFTLNVCRLLLPPDTAPLHLENWRELEALIRQLSSIYQQVQPHHSLRGKR